MDKFEKSHVQFVNKSDLDFKDISTEEERVYRFPNNEFVTIKRPLKLHVSKSGGHRVFDADGNSHYIPTGWIHLKWVAKNNEANFVT